MSVQPAELQDTPSSESVDHEMRRVLAAQRQAQLQVGPPSPEVRVDRIQRAIQLLVDNDQRIAEALRSDFGHRSIDQSRLTDVASSIEALKFARKNLRSWMRTEKRRAQFPLGLLGARAEIRYQPLGVVGVISPWNFPVNLTFAPLAGIFAAGNRVMIKPSEYTPATSELMREMIESAYDETEAAVFPGGPELGQAFSRLPFDHLLFTGSTSVAHHVMRAAAENLVPCTLELGGKSPVVVSHSADLAETASKVMNGKLLNAGQICLAPDYVLVPSDRRDEFVQELRTAVESMYPTMADNPDYTAVVNERHYRRLAGYVEAARERGEQVVELKPDGETLPSADAFRMAPTLILEPGDESPAMTDEIFGPVLPIKTYDSVDEVIDYINHRPRPLAIYYFGKDDREQERLLSRTLSGGVTLNDVIMHVSMEDLPFGGVGPSGMGAYHGRDGFRTFSHARAVFKQARIDVGKMLRPPYGSKLRGLLKQQIKP